MKFTIKRSKWYRGKGTRDSRLLLGNGKQCCFGQICSQLGVPDIQLLNRPVVRSLPVFEKLVNQDISLTEAKQGHKWVSPVYDTIMQSDRYEHGWVAEGYAVNDEPYIDENRREERLTTLLANAGHELVFED
jgi:hypothetical protein